jgi:hypothetical protein
MSQQSVAEQVEDGAEFLDIMVGLEEEVAVLVQVV